MMPPDGDDTCRNEVSGTQPVSFPDRTGAVPAGMTPGRVNHPACRLGYVEVELPTSRGAAAGRYYGSEWPDAAVIFVGGAGGGWDTPARDLYPRLCVELAAEGIGALRVRFRDSRDLGECVFDVLAGAEYLSTLGAARLGFVGHSAGGAAVIQAAARTPAARAVATLATQSNGAQAAADLPRGCALLLAHGGADEVLTPYNSRFAHGLARKPKRLVVYPGAGHGLDEVAEEVHILVGDWLRRWLAATR
jgi:pimeloyl-ACP methyl ester carboxylesterase